MKKSIIAGGISVGLLLAAALIIFVFFPGLLTYIDVKVNDPHINDVAEEFQKVEVPENFTSFSTKGLRFRMPEGAVKNRSGSSIRKGEEISVLIMENDSYKNFVQQQEMAANPDIDLDISTDPWESFLYDEETYRHFYKSMKAQYPTEYDARSDILWFIKDGFIAKDCLKLRGIDRKVFKEFADIKEESVAYEDAYKLKGKGFFAYVCKIKKELSADSANAKEINEHFQWSCTLFPDNSTTDYYFIMISGENDNIKPQVISSIELDK